MIIFLRHLLGWIFVAFGSRDSLILENLALRQQLLWEWVQLAGKCHLRSKWTPIRSAHLREHALIDNDVETVTADQSRTLYAYAWGFDEPQELVRWCDELPDVRYPIAAAGIAAIRHDTDGPHWTDIARRVLEQPPDRVQALRTFIRQFSLPGWDVSRAAEVQSNLRLLDEMAAYSDPGLVEFAGKEKARLSQAIAAARQVRPPVHVDPDEGFE
jgi:hypothetical protein